MVSGASATASLRLRSAVERLGSEECRAAAGATLHALDAGQLWALQMVDASARGLPAGALAGSSADLGDFDECLSVPAPRTRFCVARLLLPHRHSSPILGEDVDMDNGIPKDDILLGVCVPADCSPKDVEEFMTDVFIKERNATHSGSSMRVDEDMCQTNERVAMDWFDWLFISLISLLACILVAGTICDVMSCKHMNRRNQGIVRDILESFSVPHNFKRLVSCGKPCDGLDCLFGIKFFTMVLIMFAHSLLYSLGGPVHNADFLQSLLQQPVTALLTSNILYVETFFFVGAFLLSHHVLQQFSNNVAVNPIQGLLLRYIRLTPAYLLVVGAHASVLQWAGSGPLWGAHAGRERQRCRASWWANALYINNYVHTDQLCMFQSWYLAVDTQLFAASLLLLAALGRRRMARRVTLVTLLALSCGVSLIDALLRHYDATVIMRPAEAEDLPSAASFTHTYIKTHLRATTYLCGLLFGDVSHHYLQSGMKISKRAQWLCWTLALAAGAAAVFSVMVFYWPFRAPGALDRALYSGLVRLAWSACVGWVVFACATRHADAVLRLLSWPPLVPLGRLSYCAYLVNGLIGLHSMGEQRTPLQVDAYTLGREVLSSIVLTYIGALLLSLVIDSPMQALQGVITGKGRKKKEESGATKT